MRSKGTHLSCASDLSPRSIWLLVYEISRSPGVVGVGAEIEGEILLAGSIRRERNVWQYHG